MLSLVEPVAHFHRQLNNFIFLFRGFLHRLKGANFTFQLVQLCNGRFDCGRSCGLRGLGMRQRLVSNMANFVQQFSDLYL